MRSYQGAPSLRRLEEISMIHQQGIMDAIYENHIMEIIKIAEIMREENEG